jgi:hypothetical protein
MTQTQIILCVVTVLAFAWAYLPAIKLPKRGAMRDIESVIAIRDSATSPEVKAACQSLLQALLK